VIPVAKTHSRSASTDQTNGDPSAIIAFEDFPVGREIRTGGVTVTEAHIVGWAGLTGDWYGLHVDEEFARAKGPFGGRVAHGPLTFALGVGLMYQTGQFGEAILGWLGCDKLRALRPVYVQDTIRVDDTVIEARVSGSSPHAGIVVFEYRTSNQRSELIMTYKFSLLMRRRNA
jgi:acyl dehydratase